MSNIQQSTPSVEMPAVEVAPISDRLEKLQWGNHFSSFIFVAVSAAYLIGFVVVNSSLFKYGMVPYDFLQPRYVSAGLLYLSSTIGLTGLILFLIYLIRNKHWLGDVTNAEIKSAWVIFIVLSGADTILGAVLPKTTNIEPWMSGFRYPALILAFLTSSLCTTIIPLPSRFSKFEGWWRKNMWEGGRLSYVVLWLSLMYSLARIGSSFLFYPAFLLAVWLILNGLKADRARTVAYDSAYATVHGISILCFSVYLYGSLTYPLISPHIGGGKPLLISLAVMPEQKRTVGRIMGRDDWNCVMHNIALIHENSEFIYVLPNGYYADEAAIGIPKGSVVSIAYQKNAKAEHATCFE